ncbi:ROK family protein [Paenibacillus qinlingensis]|uniref:NBD/HSP70 family sugar kinase n=1 Tax=Paenibacillus qinlingensis TaxID=1837343 RepID=A0ABU1NXN8_9BACL|nr:ROK family protein [Paenibacillus qinlingensis]MDR6552230.1 putative NBD/HSP70 family sugar kinase [Paenibacillus qinlingensis]
MIYLQQVKQHNLSVILKDIWKHNQISRIELVESTGLTSGTLTNLTHELIEAKVIREYQSVSGTGSVGRKRVLLAFDPHFYRIIGLDIGRTSYELVLTDLTGTKLQSKNGNIDAALGPEGFMAIIGPQLELLKSEVLADGKKILGLGVGIPGPIDYARGSLIHPPNFEGWDGYPLQQVLESRYGIPTIIEDDARTSALAEGWYGFGRNGMNLVSITMGIGIGGGVISGGGIVRGANGLYGQVGHMTIEPNGIRCECGNKGCWETVGSIPGILRRWGGSDMDAFMRDVRDNKADACACIEATLQYLETALVNIFNMYDPEVIILGGRLYPYLNPYLALIQDRMRNRIYAFAKERVLLRPSTFGSSQSAMGGTAAVFEALISRPVEILGYVK